MWLAKESPGPELKKLNKEGDAFSLIPGPSD